MLPTFMLGCWQYIDVEYDLLGLFCVEFCFKFAVDIGISHWQLLSLTRHKLLSSQLLFRKDWEMQNVFSTFLFQKLEKMSVVLKQ